MNDPFANSGFLILSGTSPIDLSATPLQGFTPAGGPAVLAAISFPAAVAGTSYAGDEENLPGLSLAEGVFYPIPAVNLTLASGTLIGWRN